MILLSVLLLGFIVPFRVQNHPAAASDFTYPLNENPEGSIYTLTSASTIVTISSWSSTIITLIITFSMQLWSYYAASILSETSRQGDPCYLPSPYQLAVLIVALKNNHQLQSDSLQHFHGSYEHFQEASQASINTANISGPWSMPTLKNP